MAATHVLDVNHSSAERKWILAVLDDTQFLVNHNVGRPKQDLAAQRPEAKGPSNNQCSEADFQPDTSRRSPSPRRKHCEGNCS